MFIKTIGSTLFQWSTLDILLTIRNYVTKCNLNYFTLTKL